MVGVEEISRNLDRGLGRRAEGYRSSALARPQFFRRSSHLIRGYRSLTLAAGDARRRRASAYSECANALRSAPLGASPVTRLRNSSPPGDRSPLCLTLLAALRVRVDLVLLLRRVRARGAAEQ